MADEKQMPETDPTAFFAEWMKSAIDFWGKMSVPSANSKADGTQERPEGPDQPPDPAWKARKTWESGAKVLQAVMASMTGPEGMDAAAKSAGMIPDFIMDMAHQTMDAWMTFNREWMERSSRIGKHGKAYSFENIDQEIFRAFRDIYEKEFQKYFNIPSLGLTRFHQERVNKFLDKFTLYQTALNEFLQMFYIPMEKSMVAMQEKIEEMAEKGELHDDVQGYYRAWIKILEGHYMKLLKSREYTQVMTKTIDSLVQYNKAREDMLNDFIGQFPVPTQKEMDELYKDMYEMKKQIKAISKKLEAMET